jgi:hypothetical protein
MACCGAVCLRVYVLLWYSNRSMHLSVLYSEVLFKARSQARESDAHPIKSGLPATCKSALLSIHLAVYKLQRSIFLSHIVYFEY